MNSTHLRAMLCFLGLLLFVGTNRADSAKPTDSKVDFNRDIRPILSKNCFVCHGPDDGNRKAKLRLDVRDEALEPRKGGKPAIAAGHPENSRVVKKISAGEMPPEETGNKLTPAQIETIRKWIEQGAPYAEHWAFVRPKKSALPQVHDKAWPRNALDYFILSRLENEGLKPSSEADRLQLLRRVSLDLRGLPPTPAEVEAFAQEHSPNAYEKMVDRFLADPAFGERWARVWLDLARYADSAGYGSDPLRPNMWPYRDWVINAFNRNLPFDQFTIEQLAGDLLSQPSEVSNGSRVNELKIATAFHRNTMTNTEGGTDPEEFRVAAVKDRAITTMQVWMGLTMGCAQCHSHKYDPISQKDFYSFFAVFNQTTDANRGDEAPTMPTPTKEQLATNQRIDAKIAELRKILDQSTPALAAAQTEWEQELRSSMKWIVLQPSDMRAKSQASLVRLQDGSIRASGMNPANDVYSISASLDLSAITAVRLEALADETLPQGGSGRASDGNFVLSKLQAALSAANSTKHEIEGRFVRISLPGPNRILSLAEVQVFSGKDNVARQGSATQSSTDFDGAAGKAIDGNTEGEFYKANSVTHTRVENDPWWEVNLKAAKSIDKIVIWNRTDGGLQGRLAGARVQVLNESRQVSWEETIASPPESHRELLPGGGRALTFSRAVADFSQDRFPIASTITPKEDAKKGWAVAPKQKEPHTAYFLVDQPVAISSKSALTITLQFGYHQPGFNLGHFRLSVTDDSKMPKRAAVPQEILSFLDLPEKERKPAEREKLTRHFRSITPLLQGTRNEIARLEKSRPAVTNLPVMMELPSEKKRVTHLFRKGNFLDPGEVVPPATPTAFSASSQAKMDRLSMAKWLVSKENPLTARVAVNRFWARLFGVGIVETEEDFGTQGELPSHPELLDWLAVEYREGLHWDTKALLKLIVTSATYRQSSRVTPELLARDPHNRLLSRAPRYRMEAEMIRDQALALSGLLATKVGGPSVYPPQPDGLWQAAFNGERTWATSKGEDRYRRGLYTFWRRTIPYPSMAAFDAPSRETCAIKRVRSNTPVQAFVTLNDPVYVETAQALARRIIREGSSSPEERARFVLRLCLVRPPEPEQVTKLVELYQSERDHYHSFPSEATKLATDPLGQLPPGVTADELAAWTVVANVVLNLDGVLTKG
jgi:mono/diheme cytochrome c family protein